ncbi:MAG TPA: hypothetical protein PLF99_07925, partial [Tenuifilaceae bacterium]|nr:hypothetical protein [Tenuifilaceae bacterium]
MSTVVARYLFSIGIGNQLLAAYHAARCMVGFSHDVIGYLSSSCVSTSEIRPLTNSSDMNTC